MALRCFLFSSDEKTAALVRQILEGLDVEAEACSDAVAAAEKITNQAFQIVVIDWDKQPEAGVMLNTARERKAAERPITLAIVSDDKSVPGVLQAGANSILRKPVVLNQATDTLKMARDLIRAKQESAAGGGHAVAAAASAAPVRSALPSTSGQNERTLRAGEFLQPTPLAPSGQFETEADVQRAALRELSVEPVDPLKDLEPVASSVAEAEKEPEPAPPTAPTETRGLEWYKSRIAQQAVPAAAPPAKSSTNPELLGYDQTPSVSASPKPAASSPDNAPLLPRPSVKKVDAQRDEQKNEAELFAYIDGERSESGDASRPRFRLGKRTMIGALVLASFAIAAAPQAPWHPKLQSLWQGGQQSMRAWLNPQPATPVQAPAAHEDFARPGDEYKLPVAEAIPDATTDPSQIQVVPAVDPTKKPANDAANPDQPGPPVGVPATVGDAAQTQPGQTPSVVETQQNQNTAPPAQPVSVTPSVVPVSSPAPTLTTPSPAHAETPIASPAPAVAPPVASKPSPSHYVSPGSVPNSLKSQLAPATDAGSAKPLEAAMPSIEPVQVPEAAERALLADQPSVGYPPNAKGQQGTVILQVLVARDGTVQDAKFLQGSLAFARSAIDGVRQWKFKPYIMNGRPVSIQTQLTLKFNPGQ